MVEVPDAIRMVLETTAQILLLQQQRQRQRQQRKGEEEHLPTTTTTTSHRVVSASAPASELLGCILADDVLMSEPGYPPYRASIMDGYAIQCEKFQQTQDDAQWSCSNC